MAAMRRLMIWGGALVLGLGAVAAFRYQDGARPWIEANLPAWMGGAPRADFIIVSGNIEAHESVVSFKTVQSRIVELPFDEGARVKAGTLLARVDDSDYKQQVAIAQATIDAQMRQLDVAEQDVEATRKTVVSDEADVCAERARIRPRADPSDQGRGHGRRPRRRGHGAQTVESRDRARQGARGFRRQENRARDRQHRDRTDEPGDGEDRPRLHDARRRRSMASFWCARPSSARWCRRELRS